MAYQPTTKVSDGTDITEVNADGSLNVVVTDGTNSIAPNADGSVDVILSDGTDALAVNADGSLNVVVGAGSQTTITDGTDTMLVNTDGSINVILSDGTDPLAVNADGSLNTYLTDGTHTVDVRTDGSLTTVVSDGTDEMAVNADGSLNTYLTDGTHTVDVRADGSLTTVISDGTHEVDVRADGSLTTVVSDGTDELAVNADGSVNVILSDGTDGLAINADGSLNTYLTDGTHTVDVRADGSLTTVISDGTNEAVVDYDGSLRVSLGHSAQVDAFERFRVSAPFTLFDSSFQYAPSTFANQQNWEGSTTGAGSITKVANQSSVRLSTGGTTSGDKAIIQTKQHFLYQPGKSRLAMMTFVCSTAVSNSSFILGYGNVNNGIFLKRVTDGTPTTTVSFTRRTYAGGSASDNDVAQGSWNLDTLDGNGPSGITLDLTKTQIWVMDLQYLGVGRVRVGFDIGGHIVWAHEFLNANTTLATVYMSTADLPLHAQVINDDTSSGTLTADVICAVVMSEGGYEESRRQQFTISKGITALTTSTTLLPLLSIRPIATFNSVTFRGHIYPLLSNVLVTGQIHEYQVRRNCTLTAGGGAATWNAVDSTYSACQYNTDADNTISTGIIVDSGYIAAGGIGGGSYSTSGGSGIFSRNPLVQTSLNNTLETLTICVRTITGAGTALGSFVWQEDK